MLGRKTCWFFINRRKRQNTLCSYQNSYHSYYFNEEIVMTKEDNENFKNSTKC